MSIKVLHDFNGSIKEYENIEKASEATKEHNDNYMKLINTKDDPKVDEDEVDTEDPDKKEDEDEDEDEAQVEPDPAPAPKVEPEIETDFESGKNFFLGHGETINILSDSTNVKVDRTYGRTESLLVISRETDKQIIVTPKAESDRGFNIKITAGKDGEKSTILKVARIVGLD